MDGLSYKWREKWSRDRDADIGSEGKSRYYPCLAGDKGDKRKIDGFLRMRTQLRLQTWSQTLSWQGSEYNPLFNYVEGKSKRFGGATFFRTRGGTGNLLFYVDGNFFLKIRKQALCISARLNENSAFWFTFQILRGKGSRDEFQALNLLWTDPGSFLALSSPPSSRSALTLSLPFLARLLKVFLSPYC